MDTPVSLGGKRRIQFIDLAKGICIILVVLFHAKVITPATPLLSSLRMPLYFFLSGLFFKTYGGTANFMVKKLNKILIPFAFFYAISKLFCVLRMVLWHNYNFNSVLEFMGRFDLSPNVPLWFLVCLFTTNIIFCVLRRAIKNEAALALAVVLCALVGVAYGEDGVEGVCWSATALTALPFFYFGYMSNRASWLYPNKYDRYSAAIGIALIGVAAAVSYYSGNAHISMRDNRFIGSALASYTASVFVVSGILMLCKAITRIPVVSYLGRYSVIVLGTHMIVMPFILRFLNEQHITGMTSFLISGLGTLAICLALIPLALKYAPYFTAQKDIFGERTVTAINKFTHSLRPRAIIHLIHRPRA